MSAIAPTVSFSTNPTSRPSPGRLRSLFGGSASFRRILNDQAALLRLAAQAPQANQYHQAAENHQRAVAELRHALITPFDSEDIVELLLRISQTVHGLHQVWEQPRPVISAAASEWALALAPVIPLLPKAEPVDQALDLMVDLDRRYRVASRDVFLVREGDDPLDAIRQQSVRERYQALHASLRGLTFQTRRIRYRNG